MAGVPEEKLKETSDEEGAYKLLELNDTDSIYILHELYAADTAMKLRVIASFSRYSDRS